MSRCSQMFCQLQLIFLHQNVQNLASKMLQLKKLVNYVFSTAAEHYCEQCEHGLVHFTVSVAG